MQPAAPRSTNALVDRLRYQRMRDFVRELWTALLFDHQTRPDELLQFDREIIDGKSGQTHQLAELDAPAHDRERFQRRKSGLVETSQSGHHALGQPLGKGTQLGGCEIGALVNECLKETKCEQRISAAALIQPIDQRSRRRFVDECLDEFAQVLTVKPTQLQPGQQAFLLEAKDDFCRRPALAELSGPGRDEHEHARIGDSSRKVAKAFPGGGICQMGVIEKDHHRQTLRQVGDQRGESCEQPRPRHFTPVRRAAGRRDTSNERRKVVKETVAQACHVLGT